MTDHPSSSAPLRPAAPPEQATRAAAEQHPDAPNASAPNSSVHRSGVAARALAEGVGSFLVIVAGLGATITASDTALEPTLVFGLAVVAAMIAFGHVSGGHFNPAITLGSLVAGRTSVKDAGLYVLAQLVGAVAASGLVWLVLSANPQLTDIRVFFSTASNGFAEHSPIQFPLASAFLLEVVATALLVAVFLGAGSARARRDLAPFAVGLAYAGLLTFLLPVTNGGLNPARSTASAVFAEPWAIEQLWLFWAAPVVGALVAGLAYRSVGSPDAGTADGGTADGVTGDGVATGAPGALATDPASRPAPTGMVNTGTDTGRLPAGPGSAAYPWPAEPADRADEQQAGRAGDGAAASPRSDRSDDRGDDAASFFDDAPEDPRR